MFNLQDFHLQNEVFFNFLKSMEEWLFFFNMHITGITFLPQGSFYNANICSQAKGGKNHLLDLTKQTGKILPSHNQCSDWYIFDGLQVI